jgi:hypothetical protein
MSNKGWHRHRIDPVAWLKARGVDCPHITYDPKMRRGQYDIIRQMGHDGTFSHTDQLLADTLRHVAERTSYHKPSGWTPNQRYVVGPIRLATVVGMVDLKCGRFPGERQRTCMPVRVLPTHAETPPTP